MLQIGFSGDKCPFTFGHLFTVDGKEYTVEDYDELSEEEGDTKYQKFFRKALEKFGVDSPADFKSEEEKKKFFNYVDKNYKADKEED